MKQFLTVLRFELNNYFKNKSFMITTIFLVALMVGVLTVPTFIPGLLGDKKTDNTEEISAEEMEDWDTYGIFSDGVLVENVEEITAMMPAKWITYDSEEELKNAVRNEEINAGFKLNSTTDFTYVVNNMEMYDRTSEAFSQVLAQYHKVQYLLEKGLTTEEINAAELVDVSMTSEILGKDSASNFGYTYVLVFIVYFLILFYGQMIAVSVTTEKSNRAIEILVTSVNPNSLIFGKVLAGAVAGVLQAVLILGSGFVTYYARRDAWGGMLDFLFDIPANVLIVYAVFAILSYLLYAFIFGALGALVSKTEDISKSSTPVTILYVVSFFIAMMGLNDVDNIVVKAASFIPFTSGNAMFLRVSMGTVAMWEVVLSAVILVISCWVTGVFAAKLFRFGTLHYGNPVKLGKALKGVREQK